MSLRFDGTSGGGRVETSRVLNFTRVSCMLWFWKETDGQNGSGNYCSTGNETLRAGGAIFYVRQWSGGNGTWFTSVSPSNSVWHHVAVTYDTTSTSNVPLIYLDGIVRGTNNTQPTGTLTANTNGYTVSAFGATFQGRLCEFAVFDRILTPAEIVCAMNLGPARLFPKLYLPVYGVSAVEPDISGFYNHGQVKLFSGSGVTLASDPPQVIAYRTYMPQSQWFIPPSPPPTMIGLPSSAVVPVITIQQW